MSHKLVKQIKISRSACYPSLSSWFFPHCCFMYCCNIRSNMSHVWLMSSSFMGRFGRNSVLTTCYNSSVLVSLFNFLLNSLIILSCSLGNDCFAYRLFLLMKGMVACVSFSLELFKILSVVYTIWLHMCVICEMVISSSFGRDESWVNALLFNNISKAP